MVQYYIKEVYFLKSYALIHNSCFLFGRDEFWDLYKNYFHQRLLEGDLRICLYGPLPSGNEFKGKKSTWGMIMYKLSQMWRLYPFNFVWAQMLGSFQVLTTTPLLNK